jgi:hypothetical protein
MRLLLRLLAYLILAGGVIVAVVDATRSVALSALSYTTLGDAAAGLAPASPLAAADRESVTGLVMAAPLAAVAALLFIALYALAGRGRRPRHF